MFYNLRRGFIMKKVFVIIITLIILFGTGFKILNSETFRKWRLGKQLADKYGQSFVIYRGIKKDSSYEYIVYAEDTVCSIAKCNRYGKLLADSYAHYYYAPDMNRLLEDYIGECFDEYFIASDYFITGVCMKNEELVDISDSASFDSYLYYNYVNYYHMLRAEIAVYLREDVTAEEIQNALDILEAGDFNYNVNFLRVPDDIYDMVSSSGLSCFYPYSHVKEIFLEHTDSLDESGVEDFIHNDAIWPFYFVADYSPERIRWRIDPEKLEKKE